MLAVRMRFGYIHVVNIADTKRECLLVRRAVLLSRVKWTPMTISSMDSTGGHPSLIVLLQPLYLLPLLAPIPD